MKIESKVSFDSEEVRSMAEHEAEVKYPAPDGMKWVAAAKYGYIPDVAVVLISEKEEVIPEPPVEPSHAALEASEVF